MKRRTVRIWSIILLCIGTSFLLGGTISRGKTSLAAAENFLPVIDQASAPSAQPQLEATIAALVIQNAQQATQIANWSAVVSYLATKVPAQNRAATVDTLVQENAYRATDVAALYLALGSPAPTIPPTPTFGPSPLPTETPYRTQTSTASLPTTIMSTVIMSSTLTPSETLPPSETATSTRIPTPTNHGT